MANANLKKQLYKEYGMLSGKKCRNCCNCQKSALQKSTTICAVFGDVDYANCEWDPEDIACGMFNEPFAALVPARRTIVETYGQKPKKKSVCSEQISIVSLL